MIQSLKSTSLVRKTKNWLKNQFIQEIPQNLSVCEFDCHQTYCTHGKAENCKKRKLLSNSDE